jgi:ribosome-binding factor A
MQRLLGEILLRDVKDPGAHGVSVTAVEVSRDLSHATVWFSLLDPDADPAPAAAALAGAAGLIRGKLGRAMYHSPGPGAAFPSRREPGAGRAALRPDQPRGCIRQGEGQGTTMTEALAGERRGRWPAAWTAWCCSTSRSACPRTSRCRRCAACSAPAEGRAHRQPRSRWPAACCRSASGRRRAFPATCWMPPRAIGCTGQLGTRTSTGDVEGEVVESCAWEQLDARPCDAALAGFRGRIAQVPPMYSALKQGGERLYRKARRGETVDTGAARDRDLPAGARGLGAAIVFARRALLEGHLRADAGRGRRPCGRQLRPRHGIAALCGRALLASGDMHTLVALEALAELRAQSGWPRSCCRRIPPSTALPAMTLGGGGRRG